MVEDRAKVTINGLYKVVHWLSIAAKCMTLNDFWERFKVIDPLNVAKMAKYSLLMNFTPCRVAGGIGIRFHALVHLLTYLLTQFAQGIYKKVQQSWQTSALAMHLPLAR